MKQYNLKNLTKTEISKLCKRVSINFDTVIPVVKKVIEDIKENGDKAAREYTEKFDGIRLKKFKVEKSEIENATKRVPEDLKEAFRKAAKNIEKFHKAQLTQPKIVETTKGVKCWQEYRAIEKVGLYVPGGTAPLPSTLLMLAIPAKTAGCKEIIVCTPPGKDGKIPDIILYTAKMTGVTKIFKIGGAQAIAAMAYGTDEIPKVYKIFGPGNQYVTAAKMLVSTDPDGAAIDMPAGPSEVLVIADKYAKAKFVAADLLSQAEHGKDSQAILVCTNNGKALEIMGEAGNQLTKLPRAEIAKESLKGSFTIVTETIEEALEFSNMYAPEHLILNIKKPFLYLEKIQNAGSVFVGEYSCESAGDYASGTNHTLPTYGYAKMMSGVSTENFIKKITFQKLTKKGVKNIGPIVEKMADTEQLKGHKNAMTIRINSIK